MAQRIAPSLKTFMNEALPASGSGSHILAVGERHSQTQNTAFIQQHLGELKAEHDVAVIGQETPLEMNVLHWAYQDGRLSSVTNGDPRAYMRERYMKGFADNIADNADLTIAALDKGIAVVAFDSRDVTLGFIVTHLKDHDDLRKIDSQLASSDVTAPMREHLQALRSTSDQLIKENSAIISQSPMARDVTTLLTQNPDYRARAESLVAVLDAADAMRKKGTAIGYDAVSAEIMKAHIPAGRNAITISGNAHISENYDGDNQLEGTFALHLGRDANHYQVSKAMLGSAAEITQLRRNVSNLLDALPKAELQAITDSEKKIVTDHTISMVNQSNEKIFAYPYDAVIVTDKAETIHPRNQDANAVRADCARISEAIAAKGMDGVLERLKNRTISDEERAQYNQLLGEVEPIKCMLASYANMNKTTYPTPASTTDLTVSGNALQDAGIASAIRQMRVDTVAAGNRDLGNLSAPQQHALNEANQPSQPSRPGSSR